MWYIFLMFRVATQNHVTGRVETLLAILLLTIILRDNALFYFDLTRSSCIIVSFEKGLVVNFTSMYFSTLYMYRFFILLLPPKSPKRDRFEEIAGFIEGMFLQKIGRRHFKPPNRVTTPKFENEMDGRVIHNVKAFDFILFLTFHFFMTQNNTYQNVLNIKSLKYMMV